ncbi:PREDICTED: chymotrypsin-2-like [Eufriesea mexicana]|uniref:chymotrypsin-2-like n=1 Tax=Eufriesea mexicana TaxID=516756 RepID=UPI00083C26A5|nr:PREDICTED: chymotrypsin-2-like [Eufriesea mexicana]
MFSESVKSFVVFVFVAVVANYNISCDPIPDILITNEWDWNYTTNSSDYELDADRIVGGQYAATNQFPFMAVVHRLMGNGIISQCGGTIISSRWVLTAGHCVGSDSAQFLVVFGIRNKAGIGYNYYQGPGVAMLTDQAVLHPGYRTTVNDIALLYMPKNIPFGRNIRPIQLPGYKYISETFNDRRSMVIGWGKDSPDGFGTKWLKYAILPIISNYECSSYWAVTKKHVCTSAAYDQDACQGDSGGPLIIKKNGIPLQIGIVSYGDGNCPSDKPGVFTRVTAFIDWIQERVLGYL